MTRTVVPLPRRAFLGARLDADAPSTAGVRVAGVVVGGMASEAGLLAGDRIVAVGGVPVRDTAELSEALRRAGAAREVEVAWDHAGTPRSHVVAVHHPPGEAEVGLAITYGELAVAGARLRTIVAAPAAEPPRGAVLLIQGLACESVEHGHLAGLAHGWARAGLTTIRVERRGVGDSEGGPCGEVDFATDLADHRAALALLPAGVPRYLFGHSVGGMVAALLAAEHAVDGVIVYGTSTASWIDCVEASTRRQLALRGLDAETIAAKLARVRARFLDRGASGRSATYHRQLDAVDLPAAWARIGGRVLVLHGEHDWVACRDDQARIVSIVGERASLVDVPGLDHLLGWHADRAASLAAYGEGRADPAVVAATTGWFLHPPGGAGTR